MNRTDLRQDVFDELAREEQLNSSNISVKILEDIAVLKGFVPTYAEKTSAEEAARRVSGIRSVVDELVVCLEPKCAPSDEGIAAATVRTLRSQTGVPTETVKAIVNRGCIRLEGEVESITQARTLERAIRDLPGVMDVSNNLKARSASDAAAAELVAR